MYKITELSNGGELHEDSDGNKWWYLNGVFHREDGHAIEHANGFKSWFINGKYHREDGPAIEWSSGDKAWYINDQFCTTQKQFEQLMRLKAFW